jgi:signal transduction histidine kinase
VRVVNRARSLVRSYWFDAAIVLAAVGGVLELVLDNDREDAPTTSFWLTVPVELLLILPLLARRRAPFGAPVSILLVAAAASFQDGNLVPFTFAAFLSILSVFFLLGSLPQWRQSVAGLAIGLACAFVVTRNDPGAGVDDWTFIPIVFSTAWLTGFLINRRLEEARQAEERVERLEHEREESARRAVDEERQRIARELHDVVAHSVSVMTVQAGGVRRLLQPQQEREREALMQIEETGRQALAEMRRLLGILRQPTEQPTLKPQPGMGSLGDLIKQVREAGLPVEYRVQGDPVVLPPGVDLSAYRIVQEALTNALKHAGPARAKVAVRYGADALELEIENDGAANGHGDGTGHGQVGMQERVALYGGKLESGPRAGGGYAVRARLPFREAEP